MERVRPTQRRQAYRIVVDYPFFIHPNTETEWQTGVDELNRLFHEHQEFRAARARLSFESITVCSGCLQSWEPYVPDGRKAMVCGSCGGRIVKGME